MRLIQHSYFQPYIQTVLKTFIPNEEISPRRDESLQWKQVDLVELGKQKPGTILFLRGQHAGADYRIRINERDLDVWRNTDANGLRGPLESIVSWQGLPDGVKVEEGVIRTGDYSLMPYFRYDKSKPKSQSTLRPTDIWGDAYLFIFIQSPRK